MTKSLVGKVAVVTGGGQGIGRAICLQLAQDGANVIVLDLKQENAEAVAEEVKALGVQSLALTVNVVDHEAIRARMEEVYTSFGSIDILVNNAGIAIYNHILDISEKEFDAQYNVNVKGLFFTLQAAAKYMVQQGRGKIVNLTSQAGRRGEPLCLAYCMTKAAVISMTQSAALALAPYKINVNAVAPGIVDTPLWVDVDKQFAELQNLPIGEPKRRAVAAIPFGEIGQPEDVAKVVAFLSGRNSDYMTGQTVNVDGGNVLS